MQEPSNIAGRRHRRCRPALAFATSIAVVAGCAASDHPPPPQGVERVDSRLESARSIAQGGVPSPTPQLDAMAAALTSGANTQGLDQLLTAREERLRVGDQVLVSAPALPELSGERLIGQDGCVPGPVRLIDAKGLTPAELADAVREQLASTFTQQGQDFQVTVRLLQRAPRSAQVIGRVGAHVAAVGNTPAMTTTVPLPLDGPMSVYDLIAVAQGLAADADESRLSLIRHEGTPGEPKTVVYQFSFGQLVAAHLAGRDAIVQAGDQLVVPRLPDVFVYGEVTTPGRYTLRPGTTVASLLLIAGGTTLEADRAAALALGRDGEDVRATPDTRLAAGQVLFVPQVQRIYIVGPGVAKNGPLVLPASGLTAVQAISEAGWFTQYGDPDAVQILRVQDGRRVAIDVPVEDVLDGDIDERDFLLLPGDTVLVPEGIW